MLLLYKTLIHGAASDNYHVADTCGLPRSDSSENSFWCDSFPTWIGIKIALGAYFMFE